MSDADDKILNEIISARRGLSAVLFIQAGLSGRPITTDQANKQANEVGASLPAAQRLAALNARFNQVYAANEKASAAVERAASTDKSASDQTYSEIISARTGLSAVLFIQAGLSGRPITQAAADKQANEVGASLPAAQRLAALNARFNQVYAANEKANAAVEKAASTDKSASDQTYSDIISARTGLSAVLFIQAGLSGRPITTDQANKQANEVGASLPAAQRLAALNARFNQVHAANEKASAAVERGTPAAIVKAAADTKAGPDTTAKAAADAKAKTAAGAKAVPDTKAAADAKAAADNKMSKDGGVLSNAQASLATALMRQAELSGRTLTQVTADKQANEVGGALPAGQRLAAVRSRLDQITKENAVLGSKEMTDAKASLSTALMRQAELSGRTLTQVAADKQANEVGGALPAGQRLESVRGRRDQIAKDNAILGGKEMANAKAGLSTALREQAALAGRPITQAAADKQANDYGSALAPAQRLESVRSRTKQVVDANAKARAAGGKTAFNDKVNNEIGEIRDQFVMATDAMNKERASAKTAAAGEKPPAIERDGNSIA